MQDKAIKEILERFKAGTCSPEELEQVRYWLHHFNQDEPADISSRELHGTGLEIWRNIRSETETVNNIPHRLWPRIVAVAAALALIISGVWLFNSEYVGSKQVQDEPAYASDIAPGSVGATLTLANGQTIKLSDAANGELAKEAGVTITKSVDGQIVYEVASSSRNNSAVNTLSTAKGETYQIRLPDGTVVWLNAASSLTYSTQLLSAGKRTVKLTGEGYFDVAKDAAHPFVVQTRRQEVEVLGTQFNINSYADERAIATTLLEGSVRVLSPPNARNSSKTLAVLKPGQQSLHTAKGLQVMPVDTERILDWKKDEFNLEDIDFRTAMRKIARWYNVEVIYDPDLPADIEVGGWISRKNNISAVLKLIEQTKQVHFKIEGRRIYVEK